jgi:glutamyl-tRNA synthetase
MRTRFAPSPTGDLHVGGAWTALASWALARAAGGAFVVRVEDIDTPRVVRDAEARILEDLAWLGLAGDEGPNAGGTLGPYRQSERTPLYVEALAELARAGRIYPCDCSRADIARVASAPHEGEERVYPGTCRDKDPSRPMKKKPALRFRVAQDDQVPFVDGVQGAADPDAATRAGDFVVRRADGVFAYHLAVAVDDLAMQISRVVRGADLLASTARHLLVMRALSDSGRLAWAPPGGPLPDFAHVPLVLGPDGARLAKREGVPSVRDLAARGASPADILGRLAHGLGLASSVTPVSSIELAAALAGRELRFRREPWRLAEGPAER